MATLPHGVLIAATPLGNLADASPRLREALENAQVIASEDTRRTRALAHALGVEIRGRLVSHFDHNEKSRLPGLLEAARTSTVLVVSDAGMPVVSDPGLSLVNAAHEAGIPVSCLPGPSAVPTALALSGLRVGRFIFDGFAPRKSGARREWLESLKTEQRAVCFFESPHRIADTLAAAREVLGSQRRAAICRELTKLHEEVRRGTLAELSQWASAEPVRGEITVVIDGASPERQEVTELVAQVRTRVDQGERQKTVCRELAARYGVSSRELYDAVLQSQR
ncbi:16S rRNA (cytidine(1402)-2'-O)-methyltransferase [Corynebacterium poyangense]|uniref:Ribosomal RNA small subunit methyltransferase I n=1 Tax=Corynebacterium poyangense TaxID=2684405 RepID=A0A7H0SMW9_9CORY|nr:16S rRNA (cytidine(1402)-2'-O)-methyltransferase [Corynebacterium poyangense]QNQ89894.1 16S rRNA (cytidine(1402)-2'-O)-methyltransferase [Corynebacterium poyangense]